MNRLIEEGAVFLTGLGFYTRIPLVKRLSWKPERLGKSVPWLPFYGLIVGGAGALIYLLSNLIFPSEISILLSMAGTILLTGAIHEDGWADSCDGLGGGQDREGILKIMKDSRIGTYGILGLVILLLLKYSFLSNLDPQRLPFAIIAGHVVSRLQPLYLIKSLPYARPEGNSKAAAAVSGISSIRLILSLLLAGAILGGAIFLFSDGSIYLCSLLALPLLLWLPLRTTYLRKLGGYTGDLLGAAQQISEILIYLLLFVLWKYLP